MGGSLIIGTILFQSMCIMVCNIITAVFRTLYFNNADNRNKHWIIYGWVKYVEDWCLLFGFVDERMNMHTCTQQCCFKQCKIYTHILGAWVDICGIVACMKIFHYVETQHCWLKEKIKDKMIFWTLIVLDWKHNGQTLDKHTNKEPVKNDFKHEKHTVVVSGVL